MCFNTWLPGIAVRDCGPFGHGAIEMEISSSRPAQRHSKSADLAIPAGPLAVSTVKVYNAVQQEFEILASCVVSVR